MSANSDSGLNKALSVSTGSSGLMIAVMTGMKLLRFGCRCSPLGIAGLILPLMFTRNSPLTRAVLAVAGRSTSKTRPERKSSV